MVFDEKAWKKEIEMERMGKDEFLGGNLQSPIPMMKRRKFAGLDYYAPDPDYRFELELHEHVEKKPVDIEDTQGGMRHFLRWGEFRFVMDGQECALQAYKSDPGETRLFIPFKDATSGRETYGAGRYLDLEEEHYFMDGKWILDLNQAYNPWCAYNENYSCPFVPPENWLKVPVPAGEKTYQK